MNRIIVALLAITTVTLVTSPPTVGDWPYWRGSSYDGMANVTGLPNDWSPEKGAAGNVVWTKVELGSRSTPVILDGRLYTICRADPGTPIEGEKVVCVDAATGNPIWENKFPVFLSDVPAERVGWSSVVADPESGNVYVLGVCDLFLCLDGKTGKTVWSRPLHEEFGMLSTYGGRTNFPIVFEDIVIISGVITNWNEMARPNHRLIGFDKKTGDTIWFSGTKDLPDDTTYSGPSIAVINGQTTLVLGCGDGAVWGFQPRTGRPLWHFALSLRGLYTTPLVVGNTVYCSHAEENLDGASMGAVAAFQIEGTGTECKAKKLWSNETVMVGRCAPVLIDGRLYIVNDGCKMYVYDAETGNPVAERIAIGDRKQWSSLLDAGGNIYVLTENGRWAICQPTEDGVKILNKGIVRGESFTGSPITSDGRLYFPGITALYCVSAKEPGKPQRPDEPMPETPVTKNPEAALLQIVPAELLLLPGETHDLRVHAYNSLGQKLDDFDSGSVKFTVEGAGEVRENTFVAPSDGTPAIAIITAEAKGVRGASRVRIVPPLPWKFDFDKAKDAPATWVGARYRHVIRPINGNPALVKVTTIPKGTRSRCWMGPSNLSNYTISADMQGKRTDDQLPDMGLIAHGYTLDLQGNSQVLQLRSWDPVLRMAQTVPYEWKEDIWYRMKFRAETKQVDGQQIAVLKGKVWPRGEAEPAMWTVEAEDRLPVESGSPGLFGSAKVSEIYLDNIEVVANEPL